MVSSLQDVGYGFYRSELKKVAGDKLVRAATEVSKSMARKVSGAMPCQENNLASSYPSAQLISDRAVLPIKLLINIVAVIGDDNL